MSCGGADTSDLPYDEARERAAADNGLTLLVAEFEVWALDYGERTNDIAAALSAVSGTVVIENLEPSFGGKDCMALFDEGAVASAPEEQRAQVLAEVRLLCTMIVDAIAAGDEVYGTFSSCATGCGAGPSPIGEMVTYYASSTGRVALEGVPTKECGATDGCRPCVPTVSVATLKEGDWPELENTIQFDYAPICE